MWTIRKLFDVALLAAELAFAAWTLLSGDEDERSDDDDNPVTRAHQP